jgi:ribose transport system ATP-binding protein
MLSKVSESQESEAGSASGRNPHVWLQVRGLTKHFAGELALDDADLDVEQGRVHGLVGANGAGKSTLIRCLAGVTVADRGRITIAGEELRPGSPAASEKAGLAFIHQELNLIPHFTVLQNMLLGAPKMTRFGLIDWKRSGAAADAAARRVGIKFSLQTKVSELSIAERWLVMIGKALVREAAMIAMDEPTASLSAAESEQLFGIIRDLTAQGVAILYVSHRLDEVLELCDTITVLRDGRIVDHAMRGTLDKKGLIRAIIGHDLGAGQAPRRPVVRRDEVPVFSARDVSWRSAVKGVSFDVHRGEVFALGGLVGAGRTEIAELAYGVKHLDGGHFELNGERLAIGDPAEAVAKGIALVPEERRSQALMLEKSVAFNVNIASMAALRSIRALPFLSARKSRGQAERLVGELKIKTAGTSVRIGGLSGGNQQKAVIARWLNSGTKLLILDEPSRGVDIGAREEIHASIRELARAGVGIVVISSDAEELAVLADRVVVLREGRVTGELAGDVITEARIIELSYLDQSELEEQATWRAQ